MCDLDENCVGGGFVDLTGSPSGNAKVDLVAIPGQRPRNMVVLVAAWIETAWAEGSSTMTGSFPGNAEVDLVATLERRLRSRWCVFVAFVRLVSCGRHVASSVSFFVQIVWFLDPVFHINWVNSFYLFGRWIRPPYSSKKFAPSNIGMLLWKVPIFTGMLGRSMPLQRTR